MPLHSASSALCPALSVACSKKKKKKETMAEFQSNSPGSLFPLSHEGALEKIMVLMAPAYHTLLAKVGAKLQLTESLGL